MPRAEAWGGLNEVVAHGVSSVDAFTQVVRAFIEHPKFVRGMNLLHDYSDITTGHLSVDEVKSIALMVSSQRDVLGDGRWAILMDNNLNFGMGRMWQAIIEGDVDLDIRICRDMDEALDWVTFGCKTSCLSI